MDKAAGNSANTVISIRDGDDVISAREHLIGNIREYSPTRDVPVLANDEVPILNLDVFPPAAAF